MSKRRTLRDRIHAIPPAERRFLRKADDVAARLRELMALCGINQKELAERVGKSEGYVSRVLGGGVNLTLKTVAAFEAALEGEVVTVPLQERERPRRAPRRLVTEQAYVRMPSQPTPRPISGIEVATSGALVFRTARVRVQAEPPPPSAAVAAGEAQRTEAPLEAGCEEVEHELLAG